MEQPALEPSSLDHESRLAADDHIALRLWLRILSCSRLIEARLRRNLRQRFDFTLPRFDMIAQIERDDGLIMRELSRRLMVTGGNVTGLADQLETEGWITREPVADDRRATRLRLTDAGRHRFDAMAATHESWVIDLLAPLSNDEQLQLLRLLGKLRSGLHARTAMPHARPPIPRDPPIDLTRGPNP